MSKWSLKTIPSQAGKYFIVTGANSGIGYYTALELARAGANVALACRNEDKGRATELEINAILHAKRTKFEPLDLASLASVRGFAARIAEKRASVDGLINNAAVMAVPTRQTTADGFELQIGVNFLGHFALTARLLPLLMKAPAPRVIELSSIAHRTGAINFADFQAEQNYKPWTVYNQSKLAMLMFALELQRRSDAGGWGITSLAAHPGIARTELVANGPGRNSAMDILVKLGGPFVTQPGAAGALPTLLAATAPDVVPGGYYGPKGLQEFRGAPGVAKIAPQGLDQAVAKQLWALAESLTGEVFTPGP